MDGIESSAFSFTPKADAKIKADVFKTWSRHLHPDVPKSIRVGIGFDIHFYLTPDQALELGWNLVLSSMDYNMFYGPPMRIVGVKHDWEVTDDQQELSRLR